VAFLSNAYSKIHRKTYRKILKIIAVVVLVFTLVALAAINWFDRYLQTPVIATAEHTQQSQVFIITPGSGMNRIATDLARQIGLKYPRLYARWVRYRGLDRQIQQGEYLIEANMTPQDIVDLLISGRQIQYPVQFIEGWTVAQALATLWSTETIDPTLEGLTPEAIKDKLGIDFPSLEGGFFPDTYFHTRGTTDAQVLQQAHEQLNSVLNQAWAERAESLPYETPWEAIIMASVIEREAGNQAEKPDIAGVFVRRLQLGMRLQSDPTVIYGMGDRYQGNIRRQDLREETPWNTYRIDGLPPTPIALPGYESIVAALNPADGDALYFVSRGDGSHQFSATLEEHNRAVNRYIRNQNDSQ
jgi:UPF0755 protein